MLGVTSSTYNKKPLNRKIRIKLIFVEQCSMSSTIQYFPLAIRASVNDKHSYCLYLVLINLNLKLFINCYSLRGHID